MFHAPKRRNKSKNIKMGICNNQPLVGGKDAVGNKKNEKQIKPLGVRNIQKQENQQFQKKVVGKVRE